MSNVLNWLGTLVAVYGGGIVGAAVSAIYFTRAANAPLQSVRILSSAFGISLAFMLATATFFWPEQYRYKAAGVQAYYWLQLVPLVLLTLCISKYPGPRKLHYLLVPLGLLAWLWSFATGWLFVAWGVGVASIQPVSPNPSIERTSQRPLRALCAAAHVER